MWLFCLPQGLLWPHTNTDACLWGAYVKYKGRKFTVRISCLCKVKKWLFQRKVFFGIVVISGPAEQPTWHFVMRCVIRLETYNSLHIIEVNFKWNPKGKRSVYRTMCRGYHSIKIDNKTQYRMAQTGFICLWTKACNELLWKLRWTQISLHFW